MNTVRWSTGLVALLLGVAACGEGGAGAFHDEDAADGSSQEARDVDPRSPPPPSPSVAAEAGRVSGASGGAAGEVRLPEEGQQTAQDTVAPSMIIRSGHAAVEVDSLEAGVAQVRALAEQLGGYVASSSIQAGDRRLRQGTLELKIPASRFDEAVGSLGTIGEVEEVTVDAHDVGEEFVDVTARLDNARRLEERLLELLAERAGELGDVLSVERELARVREQIERYQGRLRYLESRVALSTLTVTVHEPRPLIGEQPGTNVIIEAFRQAWRNFVGAIAWFIASLGLIVPIAIALAAAWLLGRRIYQWRRASVRKEG